MNDVLKQRLVGALILLALGVVFWPIIFVEPGERRGGEAQRIPPRPQVDTSPVEPPDMAGLRPSPTLERTPEPEIEEDSTVLTPSTGAAKATAGEAAADAPAEASRSDTAAAELERPTRSEPPVRPALDADGIPISWILQVASVSSADRADQLRRDLLDMGHKAYVKKVRSGDKTLYRVYVGPKVEKARLERIQGEVDTKFGVKTLITRYYP